MLRRRAPIVLRWALGLLFGWFSALTVANLTPGDKALIEFKLGSSSSLKRNLEKQVAIYEKANNTAKSVKAIICYTRSDEVRAGRILMELGLDDDESLVVIDARNDNKPSASKA